MKSLRLVQLVLLMVAVGISCSNNDRIESLQGTWMLTSEEVLGCDDPAEIYSENIPCSDSLCFRISFHRQGKMKMDVVINGTENSWDETYTVKGNQISICGTNGCRTRGSFDVSDTKLMFTDTLEHGCIKKEYYKKLIAGK